MTFEVVTHPSSHLVVGASEQDPGEQFTNNARVALASPAAVQYTTVVDFRRVIGLISGTSMDGIDVAAADLRLNHDTLEVRPLGHSAIDYPQGLGSRLVAALPSANCTARELCMLDTEVGRSFATAARHGMDELAGGRADLVASLGQTLYHWVQDGRAHGTLQLGQPAWIAEATGLPVVADLRARDVAAGGHGAPLAGVLDALWLADEPGTNVALNIGGIANVTVVGGPEPLAYDTGPGNALIDAAANMVTQGRSTQDTNGEIAARGAVHPGLLKTLLSDPYFREPPPKSTGKEHFNADYVRRAVSEFGEIDDADLLATLTELTAVTVANACGTHEAVKVVASGGGVDNPTLVDALRKQLDPIDLIVSDDLGLPSGGKEAYLTAVLGFLTWNGLPGNVPGTTGARGPRLLGSITPGEHPLELPEPAKQPARRLRILRSPEWRPRASR
jgi:anhydro-N-acetylmuramic acid kinase